MLQGSCSCAWLENEWRIFCENRVILIFLFFFICWRWDRWRSSISIILFRCWILRTGCSTVRCSIFGNWNVFSFMQNWKGESQCLLGVPLCFYPFFICSVGRIDCWNCELGVVRLGNFQWCCNEQLLSVAHHQYLSSQRAVFSLLFAIFLWIIVVCSRTVHVGWEILFLGWVRKSPNKMSCML